MMELYVGKGGGRKKVLGIRHYRRIYAVLRFVVKKNDGLKSGVRNTWLLN